MVSRRKALARIAVAALLAVTFALLPPSVTRAAKTVGDSPQQPLNEASVRKEAKELLSKLTRSAASYVEDVSHALDPTRSLRIQTGLLREDLIWQNRGLTSRQLDLMVLVSVALTIDHVEEEIDTLRRFDDSASTDQGRLETLVMYREQAVELVARMLNELGEVRDYELGFRF